VKIAAVIIIILGFGIGYFLPIPIVRTSINKTINFLIKEIYSIDWLFAEKDCGDKVNLQKDYCSDKAK